MTRKAIVAGQFYEEDAAHLKEQIKQAFLDKNGPGKLPGAAKKEVIRGAIVPHAGFTYSGPCAAHVYKRLAESDPPDLYLILGTNHTGLGRSSVLLENFETPLGEAEVDQEFGEELLNNTEHLNSNPSVHAFEHSIEVQLPFLQFTLPKFRFVPLVVSSPSYLDEIAEGIRKTAEQMKKRVTILASSDFTHYGINYGYYPFKDDLRENIERLDMDAIGLIQKFDVAGFHSYIRRTGVTICGFLPIMTLLKTLEKGKSELISYYLSGDLTKDYSTSVSYAGIVFK
ncbi:MAG: AmmeMemoRadiSam system protein B [Nanoarchaeota archaeon]|nr:AmmeMemoRadiSam system protein B [Nanoarchaeota archaeon]